MGETEKKYLNTFMEGVYQDNGIWVEFSDNTRKFYERSYYGKLYNANKQEILSIFSLLEEDPKSKEMIIDETKMESVDKRPKYIVLHPIEALYLIERGKLDLISEDGESISFNELIENAMDVNPKVWQQYIVYRDIRHRGYIIRVGYGGHADFRVYERGAKFAKDTSKYVYYIIRDGSPVPLNELDATVNQVLGDRKILVLAIFDTLGDSTFYKLEDFHFKNLQSFNEQWNSKVEIEIEETIDSKTNKIEDDSANEE
ncbi:MAG: tRNA-intron lyase [Candidatus Lokiarchaeota archaeon]|nr:tRNA-intron lyase [Candidatus Lokiarchaeota archaeon]